MSDKSVPGRTTHPARAGSSAAFSPLYRQIRDLLVQSLHQGEWKPGEAIPSEIDLAARFQVSQGTVRKAIDELAAENLLVRRQGKGTFVATHHEAHIRFRFLRLTPDESRPMVSGSRILECRRMRPPPEIAAALELRTNEQAVKLQRVLSFDDLPTILDDIWLPGSAFRGLTAESLAENREPMYAHFESEFGVSMVRADEKIKAVSAGAAEAALLEIPAGSPLLQVERISYTYGDRPMEVRRGLYFTERFHYRNSLN